MSAVTDYASAFFLVVGAFFYCAGTVGLLRFPDVYARLHALTKADNLGLGCVLAGLAVQAESLVIALKLLLGGQHAHDDERARFLRDLGAE